MNTTEPDFDLIAKVRRFFQQLDENGEGVITEEHLQEALLDICDCDDQRTIDYIIRYITENYGSRDGKFNLQQFYEVYRLIGQLMFTFNKFGSNRLRKEQVKSVLSQFGWSDLSDLTINSIFETFDTSKRKSLNLLEYIRMCLALWEMTKIFKRRDVNQTGVIVIDYQEFIRCICKFMNK
ncbi:Programmed cell death protein 6-like protein [Dinothrombium tinctorium]|uniref:Programmed cell death protein 6-like protein n=1 Tax=Dinothrombium tinctorium TaxID=1965070 RepID=A0A443R7A5_9ACAR|nr:Programmed cell death protein 6-like protein [Dinothrombium tinctorium]